MSPLHLLLCVLVIHVSCQNANTPNPLDAANNYLRSFLPWWPKTEEISLRTAPTVDNLLSNSTNSNDDLSTENGTIIDNGNESSAENGTLIGQENNLSAPNGTLSEKEENDPVDPSTLEVSKIPRSPLDELSPESLPKSVASSHDGNFIINFDEMGECPRDCSTDLREALGIVLKDISHIERYHRICEKYINASTCVNEDVRCDNDDRGMFEMMTSGLHYMCVEQQLAFNATIQCIDNEAGLVQSECEGQCQTKNLFMNWIMRSAMQSTIQQGVNGIVGAATGTNPNPLGFLQGADGAGGNGWADMLGNLGNPPTQESAQQGFENFRQFTNDLCKIGDCMLDCIRSKFNTRCEGSAGTLLSEVFVRPIASSQDKLTILRPILGMFMPEQCSYLHNNADLKKHRIDSTMDEELKRMYSDKAAKEIRERAEQDELLSSLVPLDENGVPLPRALPELETIQSPLDVSVKTLDQLILDMYSKNESKALNIAKKNNVTATFLDEIEKNSTTSTTTETYEPTTTTVEPTTTPAKSEATTESDSSEKKVEPAATVPKFSEAESSGEKIGEIPQESSGSLEDKEESSGEGSGEVSYKSSEASGAISNDEGSGETSDLGASGNGGESSGDGSGEATEESTESSGYANEDLEASGTQRAYGGSSGEPPGIGDNEYSSGSDTLDSSGYSDDVML